MTSSLFKSIAGPPAPSFANIRQIGNLRGPLGKDPSQLKAAIQRIANGEDYREFYVERYGRRRRIEQPVGSLEHIHQRICALLEGAIDDISEHAHGFVAGRSIVTNASPHTGKAFVQTIDVKDFFESTTERLVIESFIALGVGEAPAEVLGALVCRNGHLPTGARTSPAVSNLAMRSIDIQCQELALTDGLTYTRYADDLTFSGAAIPDSLVPYVRAMLRNLGYEINSKKLRLRRSGQPLFVTGLAITSPGPPKLRRSFRKKLRTQVYFSNMNGTQAQANFEGDDHDFFKAKLTGRLHFANSIDPVFVQRLRDECASVFDQLMPLHPGRTVSNRDVQMKYLASQVKSNSGNKPEWYVASSQLDLS